MARKSIDGTLIRWAIIGRGWAGWHAQAADGLTSSSGGHLQDRPWRGEEISEGYLRDAAEGAIVYDAQDADVDAFSRLVISGPMAVPGMAPNTIRRFLAGPAEPLREGDPIGSLDYVDPCTYRRLLSKVPGIRVGTVHVNREGKPWILWDTTTDAAGVPQPDGATTHLEPIRRCAAGCGFYLEPGQAGSCPTCEARADHQRRQEATP